MARVRIYRDWTPLYDKVHDEILTKYNISIYTLANLIHFQNQYPYLFTMLGPSKRNYKLLVGFENLDYETLSMWVAVRYKSPSCHFFYKYSNNRKIC